MSGIVIDAPAIVAVIENEPEAPSLREVYLVATHRWIAAMDVLGRVREPSGAADARGLDVATDLGVVAW